jgi:hypothetical protein
MKTIISKAWDIPKVFRNRMEHAGVYAVIALGLITGGFFWMILSKKTN